MERKDFISKITGFLSRDVRDAEGNEIPYAVCAPTKNSDGTENGARLYCFGGANLAEIKNGRIEHLKNSYVFRDGKVTANQPSQYIEESEFMEFVSERKKYNSMSLDELDLDKEYHDFLRKCVNIAEKWSKSQNKEERSIETGIVQKSRENKTSCVIDMEFNIPYTRKCKIMGIDVVRSPRIDLVIYDETDRSFGMIELKNEGDTDMNAQNMRKHYADFTAVLDSDCLSGILEDLQRRTVWLRDNGIITLKETFPNVINKIWYGFLFVGDNVDSYRRLYKDDLLLKRPVDVDPWIMKERKAGQIKVSDLRDRYEDMIKNEWVRYKFCTPKELDRISLSFSDMLTYDQFMGILTDEKKTFSVTETGRSKVHILQTPGRGKSKNKQD